MLYVGHRPSTACQRAQNAVLCSSPRRVTLLSDSTSLGWVVQHGAAPDKLQELPAGHWVHAWVRLRVVWKKAGLARAWQLTAAARQPSRNHGPGLERGRVTVGGESPAAARGLPVSNTEGRTGTAEHWLLHEMGETERTCRRTASPVIVTPILFCSTYTPTSSDHPLLRFPPRAHQRAMGLPSPGRHRPSTDLAPEFFGYMKPPDLVTCSLGESFLLRVCDGLIYFR